MKCWICDRDHDGFVDDRDGKVRHCSECEGIVQETLAYWEKKDRELEDGEIETLIPDELEESYQEYVKYRYGEEDYN